MPIASPLLRNRSGTEILRPSNKSITNMIKPMIPSHERYEIMKLFEIKLGMAVRFLENIHVNRQLHQRLVDLWWYV